MRLAALERVMSRCMGAYVIDVSDEGWTVASLENRWFRTGEELARNYYETEDGALVERRNGPASRR
ncbi:MAG: hypothetical protein HY905_27930 [Deltaproteobacteria bacterium]|nr:hypothetical protein [Deltaproteobacteria bacterium]